VEEGFPPISRNRPPGRETAPVGLGPRARGSADNGSGVGSTLRASYPMGKLEQMTTGSAPELLFRRIMAIALRRLWNAIRRAWYHPRPVPMKVYEELEAEEKYIEAHEQGFKDGMEYQKLQDRR